MKWNMLTTKCIDIAIDCVLVQSLRIHIYQCELNFRLTIQHDYDHCPQQLTRVATINELGQFMIFNYETKVKPEWIGYNGHMQDAFHGLMLSYTVDTQQDTEGFDQDYRTRTDCTTYLLEGYRLYPKVHRLRESSALFRPRPLHRHHAMLSTLDPGHLARQIRPIIHRV